MNCSENRETVTRRESVLRILERPFVKLPVRLSSPFSILCIVALSIIVTETMIMLLISSLGPLSRTSSALIDSFSLILLLAPVLYIFLLNPLLQRIAEQKEAEESIRNAYIKLEEVATTELLARLLNRPSFELHEKGLSNPVLLLIDIDGFKHINDFYGIEVGNLILIEFAVRLKCLIPDNLNVNIYKLGGDDFGVLFEHNLPPFSFLQVAKEARLYGEITKKMIEKGIAAFKDTDYELSINISVEDINDNEIEEFMIMVLKKNPVMACRTTFEIIESEGVENYEIVFDFIQKVKKYGCKIAIDDFGAGYSNFGHTMQLDIDFLKIDSSLIKEIDRNEKLEILTETIVNFAKKLGMKTIAEYVHSEEVYKKVKALGVDYSQGYYIGKPEPGIVRSQLTA